MERIMLDLSEEIGVRFGGQEGEHRAARYLKDKFEEYGLPARLQKYGFIGWLPEGDPSVMLLTPERRTCSTAPIIYSASTPEGGIRGRVVWQGYKELIAGLYEMPTYAVIDDQGDYLAHLVVETKGPAIPLLNPRPIFRLPQIVIGLQDHQYIQRTLEAGKEVTAQAEIHTKLLPDAVAYNVIAEYRNAPGEQRVVACAHYDTQLITPGCYDNASGTAGMFGLLERVRALNLPINIDFIAMASEEIGMHGSMYYVMDAKERGVLKHVTSCICFDQISAGAFFWLWAGGGEFQQKAEDAIREAGIQNLAEVKASANMPGADNWPFHLEGIPSCLLMWWRLPDYHKPTDTFDKVDMNRVRISVDAAVNLIKRLV